MDEIVRYCNGLCLHTKLNFDTIYFRGSISVGYEENGKQYYHDEYRQEMETMYVTCVNCGTEYTIQELDIQYVVEDGWAELKDRRRKR